MTRDHRSLAFMLGLWLRSSVPGPPQLFEAYLFELFSRVALGAKQGDC